MHVHVHAETLSDKNIVNLLNIVYLYIYFVDTVIVPECTKIHDKENSLFLFLVVEQ